MLFVKLFIVSALTGYILNTLHFPIPWLLGPIFTVMTCRHALHIPVIIPRKIRNSGLIIMGYVMGRSITRDIALRIARQLPVITAVTVLTILFCIFLALIIYKPMKVSPASAILGSVPGGMTQMAIMCDDIKEADLTIVTFMQTIRYISVVVLVPFIVLNGLAENTPQTASLMFTEGFAITDILPKLLLCVGAAGAFGFLSEKLKLPTPYLLGPVFASAVISVSGIEIPAMPRLMTILAQLTIGYYIGTNLKTESLKDFKKVFLIALLNSMSLIGFTFLSGLLLTRIFEMQLITAFLSTAPGGISEMAVTALAVNADLSFITAFQIFRFIFILIIVPPVLRRFLLKIHKAKNREAA